jgi:hypothetical protein
MQERDICARFLAESDEPDRQVKAPATKGTRLTRERRHEERTPSNNAFLFEHYSWHAAHAPQAAVLRTSPWGRRYARIDANPVGAEFLHYHHRLVHRFEAWRAERGLQPLEPWDPGSPIPAAFAYPGRRTETPGVPIPSWATPPGGAKPDPLYGYRRLGEFPTVNRLGKALDVGWHAKVAEAVGGDFGVAATAPRDPVFWAWCKRLDDILHTWEGLARR